MDTAPLQSLVADPVVGRAIAAIVPNADQQLGSELLERSFVDIGILAQLYGPSSQILFGRRGTGKSHLLRILAARKTIEPTAAAVFVDVRNLGSAQLMTDPTKSLTIRSVSVFRDLLGQLQSHLLDLATDPNQPERIDALESVSALAETVATVSSRVSSREIVAETDSTVRRSSHFGAKLSKDPSLAAESSSENANSRKFSEHYTQVFQDTIVFAEISSSLERALATLGITRLYLILDEWSTIPSDVQPVIAEYLKRTMLPSSGVVLKIGSLTYRSNFAAKTADGTRIGLEFGGEVTRNLDLDEHYASEKDATVTLRIFTDLLWRHLVTNIDPSDYLQSTYDISTADALRERIFSDYDCFADLLRAAAGVARDFLSIFTAAYFRAAVARTGTIERQAVQHAALMSFQSEKLLNLDSEQESDLNNIVAALREFNGGCFFLLDSKLLIEPAVQSLFDMRVIHVSQRYYTGQKKSDHSSTLYTLDYGASLMYGLAEQSPEHWDVLNNLVLRQAAVALPDLSHIILSH
jgi:hypothetical protein